MHLHFPSHGLIFTLSLFMKQSIQVNLLAEFKYLIFLNCGLNDVILFRLSHYKK